jgi:peptidoglycan/xylan/chitin deacetylase (PgdA/CDA1 family)
LVLSSATRADVLRSGPANCRTIALTFDMCPVKEGSGYDRALVQVLMQRHIPATFFLSGRWIDQHDAETRELLSVPFFELGTHGETHVSLAGLPADVERREILGPVTRLDTRYQRTATLFRPPYGEFRPETVKLVEAAGLKFVLWSIVSGDPDPHLTATAIINDIEWRARPGSLIIFHANGRGWHTREVVEALYQRLVITKGLRPVTVTELFDGCTGRR